MPPIPLTPAPDPTPTLSRLSRRLQDVRSYQIPRLRDCSTSLARDLANEARGDLEAVRAGLEDAKEECEALPPSLRGAVMMMWDEVEAEYIIVRDEYRAALVASKRAQVAASSRHELLDPDEVPKAEATTSAGGDDALQTKTNDVTDALRRTTQLLQTELERSVLSVQMLDESTRTLRTTHGLYDTYDVLVTASAQLVRAIEKADWWDRALIFAALGLFLLVVGYVIKKRVLDRVGGFAAWWIGGSYRLVKMGVGAGASKQAIASAAAASASAAAASAQAQRQRGGGQAGLDTAEKGAATRDSPIDAVLPDAPTPDSAVSGSNLKDEL